MSPQFSMFIVFPETSQGLELYPHVKANVTISTTLGVRTSTKGHTNTGHTNTQKQKLMVVP